MYQFKLRNDMPPGFVRNPNFPELPAAVEFLRGFEEKKYADKDAFKRDISGFGTYLAQKNIQPREMESLQLFLDGAVGASNDGPSVECHFGTLEQVADDAASASKNK